MRLVDAALGWVGVEVANVEVNSGEVRAEGWIGFRGVRDGEGVESGKEDGEGEFHCGCSCWSWRCI